MFGQTLASGGWAGNLIVYLITKYNVKSIDATQVNNVIQGCFNFFPIIAAFISDSFYGPFPLIAFFAFVSLLVRINILLVILDYTFNLISGL